MTTPKKIRALTLDRGACYGRCPVYQVTVTADGRVAWCGGRCTDAVGPQEWTVPPTTIAALEAALARAGFSDLKSEYTDFDWTDAPSVIVTVIYADGTEKSTNHYHGCEAAPRALTALEDRIDRILGTKAYIGRGGLPDADEEGDSSDGV
jgi:hypothetical protein